MSPIKARNVPHLYAWLAARGSAYRRSNPRVGSTVIMMAAAGTAALVAVGYAKLVDAATELMGQLATDHQGLFLFLSPLCFAMAWALVRYFAPSAGGSGLPQVMAAIEVVADRGSEAPNVNVTSNLRLMAVKTLSSLAALVGGAALGREGPTIQLSAAVFDIFDVAFKRTFSRRRSREALLIAGGAAGLAAAFNTPLGGIVFAIEELAKNHFKTFKGPLILAIVVAGYVTQALLGPYLFVGHPAIGAVNFADGALAVAAAVPIGLAGAAFGVVLYAMMTRLNRLGWRARLGVALAAGLIMSGVACLLGPDASGGGSLLIKKLLFHDARDVSWTLACWRVLGVLVTYASGCAAGIFAPALAAGAALGAKVASLAGAANPSVVMVLGMIAFLTGMSRSPFTSFILVFEMTDRQAAVLPMMAAAALAQAVARLVDEHSFYEKMRNQLLGRALSAAAAEPDVTPPQPPPPRPSANESADRPAP